MEKGKESGVFQLDNGLWAFRFAIVVDGKTITKRKTVDEFGNKLRTKKQAIKAREAAIIEARIERERQHKISRRTVEEIYKEYCDKGRSDRAYMTIRKQDCMWRNHIKEQQYQDSLIKLVPVKTRNGNRTVYLSDKLKVYFQKLAARRAEDAIKLKAVREQKQRFIDDLDGKRISSTEMVNCLPDGTIQTVNAMKYPTRHIKEKLGIDFKYHYLRHTYGTRMAELNTPEHLLLAQMGHGNIRVTQLYYLAVTKSGVDVLQDNLNKL